MKNRLVAGLTAAAIALAALGAESTDAFAATKPTVHKTVVHKTAARPLVCKTGFKVGKAHQKGRVVSKCFKVKAKVTSKMKAKTPSKKT